MSFSEKYLTDYIGGEFRDNSSMYLTTFSKWNSNKTRETVGNAGACVDSFLRAEGVLSLKHNFRISS